MRNLKLIAAIGENFELGCRNDLIWRIREDLQFFKQQTMGSHIIMGRRTFESLPPNLPGRKYVVLTSNGSLEFDDGHMVFRNIDDTLAYVAANPELDFYVIGGGQIYNAFLPYVDTMFLTEIKDICTDADTFFPKFDKSEWERQEEPMQEENGSKYSHVLYTRKLSKVDGR